MWPLLRTYVTCDDGETLLVDTIQYQGDFWLVPKWIATTTPEERRPARIIRLPMEYVQDLGHNFLGSGIRARKLTVPMPRAFLEGRDPSPPSPHFDVQEAPDVVVRR